MAADVPALIRAAVVGTDMFRILMTLLSALSMRCARLFPALPTGVTYADERLIQRCHGATSKGRDVLHSSSPLARSEAAQAWPLRNTRADL